MQNMKTQEEILEMAQACIERSNANSKMIVSSVSAQWEKLNENSHKPPITSLSLPEAYEEFKGESWELAEEMQETELDPVKIRKEAADCQNYLGAMICACDKLIKDENRRTEKRLHREKTSQDLQGRS